MHCVYSNYITCMGLGMNCIALHCTHIRFFASLRLWEFQFHPRHIISIFPFFFWSSNGISIFLSVFLCVDAVNSSTFFPLLPCVCVYLWTIQGGWLIWILNCTAIDWRDAHIIFLSIFQILEQKSESASKCVKHTKQINEWTSITMVSHVHTLNGFQV